MFYQVFGLEDFEEVNDFFKESYLPAPYQTSLSDSQEFIRFALFHEKKLVFGFRENSRLKAIAVFLKEDSQLSLETLLLSRIWAPSFKGLKESIIQAAQSVFAKNIIFPKEDFLFSEMKGQSYTLPTLKTALVLGGGGAKGAYEIGTYTTILKEKISIDIVTGTSVGSLNGAIILQDNLSKAKELWENIESSQVLDFQYNEKDLITYSTDFLKAAVKSRGISTVPLLNLVEKYVSPKKIQTSEKDFYVITTAFPQLEEKIIFLKEVPENEVTHWLVASSSFYPGMEMTEINGQKYVDGGYKNNIAEDVAFEKGARRIIAVDLKAPGVTKSFKENIPVIMLKTPWNLGEVLYFNGQQAAFNIALGKLEMEKALFLACGYWYTFNGKVKQKQYVYFQNFLKQNPDLVVNRRICQELSGAYGKKVLPYNIGLALLEVLGQYFQILPDKKYSFLTFTQEMKESYLEMMGEMKPKQSREAFNRGLISPRLLFGKQQFTRLLNGKEVYTFNKDTLILLQRFLEYIVKNTVLEEETENGSH